MSLIKNEEGFYAVKLGSSTMEFRELHVLEEWLEAEKEFWGWLTSGSFSHGAVELFRFNFLEPINRANKIISYEAENHALELGSKNAPYFDRSSAEAALTSSVREKYGELTAYFTLLFLLPQRTSLWGAHGNIKTSMDTSSQIYERSLAAHIVFTREDVSDLIINSEEGSVRDKVSFFAGVVQDANKDLRNEILKTQSVLSVVEIEQEARVTTQKRQFEKRIQFYRDQAQSLRVYAKNTFSDAKNDVEAAKTAFHDTADFKASVEYWSDRKKNHRYAKNAWLVAVLISMALTFFGLISYYSAGGATGLARMLHSPQNSASSSVVTENSPNPANDVKKPTTEDVPKLNIGAIQDKITPSNATVIADISGAFLLLTLMGLLIRICLNQFNSNAHYMNDAAERVVFTKTYLALLSENKLNADMDRKLALDSLFRSSTQGAPSEIPFSNPIEMVVRSAEKKIT
ncbi:hypothetical protein [Pseudomonas migulae]